MKSLFHRFFYITHLENLASIRANGLLSHNVMVARKIIHVDISDPGAQRWRDRLEPVFHRPIHDYVPLYINPRNPMLYLRRELHQELTIIKISSSIVDACSHVYTDGNAASKLTAFASDRTVVLNSIPALTGNSWTDFSDGKRRMCSEVLIYPSIQPMYLEGAVCSNAETAKEVRKLCNLVSVIDPQMFFQAEP